MSDFIFLLKTVLNSAF